MTLRIDIGGGTIPAEGFTNLDPAHGVGQWRRRIQDGIPAEDDTVDEARASHVMEHIPAGSGDGERIWVMNEVWRALKPGGKFTIIVPLIMEHGRPVHTWHAWADPDHRSYWILPESWLYFCEGPFKPNADYGMKIWQALDEATDTEVRGGWEGVVTMRKPL